MEFSQIIALPFKDQCIWFLNGFWKDPAVGEDPNLVYEIFEKFEELDLHKNGSSLDEFNSHRLLEKFEESMTVVDMRVVLKEIDTNADSKMACLEYLIYRYGKTVEETLKAPQGTAPKEEVEAATKKMNEVQVALEEVLKQLKESEAAIAEFNRIEEEYKAQCEALEKQATDENLGVVKRNRAANQLEQLKAEDPLPLRRAKITQEAATRKVQKAQAALEIKLDEAKAELEIVKQKGGIGNGSMYWMERELFNADKRLPNKKQKYDHTKPFSFVAP